MYPGTGFQTQHVSFLRTEVRQPLLAGRGSGVTAAAGPAALNRGQLGRGVAVAQFEQEIADAELEAKLQLLVRQVQQAYWDLWLAQQELLSLSASRDSAKELLDRVRARTAAGLPGGDAANEAQAEEVYLQRESAVNDATVAVLQQAGRTRRLVGLPAADQRVLTAVQSPFDGEVILDWHASAGMAIQQRAELRQQQKRVEVLGMQLAAADNLTQPQLDLVAGAQLNGFGDEAIGANSGGVVNSLLSGDHVGWSVGLEFSTPLGLRSAHARRRYLCERLSKARAVAIAQQQEVQHELNHSFHEVDRTFKNLQIATQRRAAALRRERAADADFEAGRTSVDLLLRAQASRAEAERSYVSSLVGYNKALVELKYREGSLLAESCR
ncbi:MAG: TolC family protein [Planctomycetales bacterium]|nr:TolC family protein [Planctomycetales bacterium]